MDSKKRKVSHNYNLRSKARRARIESEGNLDDASSSNNLPVESSQLSEGATQQRRRKRGNSHRSSSSSHSPASKKSKSAADDIKCVICLDTVDDRHMKFIPCGHGFHRKCCNNWLTVNDACPVCRTVVRQRRRRRLNLQDLNRERIIDNAPISDIIYFFTLSVFRT